MDRFPVFDERGLDNPIYTYLHTGKMTYPAYGYFDGMYVHPPTHYFVTAEFMKMGLPLFPASEMPLFLLTAAGIFLIATGRFSFSLAVALVLGSFSGVFIWGDFVTIRPDVHLSVAWFTGLVALLAARSCDWSSWRLFAGAAISTYAGTLHYWGTPAFLAVLVFAVWFLASTPRARWLRGLEVMGAGGLLVGGLYLTQFVIPQWHNIREFTALVQGQGSGWQDAYDRHRAAYASFDPRLFWLASAAPSPLLSARSLVDVLLTPVFDWRVPVIFIAVPVLLIWRETRPLAVAGAVVPLFVLFYTQGKTIGYTGYFVPEVVLYLVACIALFLELLTFATAWIATPAMRRGLVTSGAAIIAVLSLAAVPVSMGIRWQFGPYNDVLEVNRAAAFDVVGSGGPVAITSIPTWYVAGGTVVWQAANTLTYANPLSDANAQLIGVSSRREFPDIRELLRPFSAVISDTDAWWINWFKGAPLNDWYQQHLLEMKGFVINLPHGYPVMVDLLYAVTDGNLPVKGYLIGKEKVIRFSENGSAGSSDKQGDEVSFTVLSCATRPTIVDSRLRLSYSFPLRTEPDAHQPYLVMLAAKPADLTEITARVGAVCATRDLFVGQLTEVSREELKAQLKANDRYIQIFTARESAIAATSEEK